MAGKYYRRFGWLNHSNLGEVVTMIIAQVVLFLLAIINLVAIAVLIYFKKSTWALALSIVEIVIVYLSMML